MKKITEEFLKEQGFTDSGEKHGYNVIWRKPIIGSFGYLNFVMGNYPVTNPNVGVLGIYHPEEWVSSVPDDLIRKETWTEEESERAENHKIKMEESLVNFTWYLDDQKRFKRLIADIEFER